MYQKMTGSDHCPITLDVSLDLKDFGFPQPQNAINLMKRFNERPSKKITSMFKPIIPVASVSSSAKKLIFDDVAVEKKSPVVPAVCLPSLSTFGAGSTATKRHLSSTASNLNESFLGDEDKRSEEDSKEKESKVTETINPKRNRLG